MLSKSNPRIVVLGGGFGGLETALYLRKCMPDQAEIILVSDRDHFIFKPNTIYIPFGLSPSRLQFSLLRPTKHKDIKFVQARARDIDPISKRLYIDSYDYDYQLSYDYLVVATGAGMRTGAIPGLGEFAHTIWTPEEMMALRTGFQQLAADAREGKRQEVLFVVPPNNEYSGPLYEMALMLDTWLHRKKAREQVSLTFATCEENYVQAFGPRLHEVVHEEFKARKITAYSRYEVDSVEHRRAMFRNGDLLPFDLLVTFPPYAAATHFKSLPTDYRGLIRTDPRTLQVDGYPELFAVGDTADFPVKQAQLALRQADAAAEQISARIQGTVPRFEFEPTGMYVMEGLDGATFVQAPLRATGRPDRPVEVLAEEEGFDGYRIGSSPLWKLGKMAVGIYLPWRFKAGNPFHSGAPWKGLEASVKIMSGVLAR